MSLSSGEKKKRWALGVLGVVAAYMVYSNVLTSDLPGPANPGSRPAADVAPTTTPVSLPAAGNSGPAPTQRAPGASKARNEEFHPVLRNKRADARPQFDPATIDPTLRTDLLARVQAVELAGGNRNLFQFATAPPKEAVKLAGDEPKVKPFLKYGPEPPPPPPPPPGPKPPPPVPPITLKFYGFSTTRVSGKRTAYFLDGDNILLAAEGDTVGRRYKILKISPASVLVEDLDAKREQSVPLSEEAPQTGGL